MIRHPLEHGRAGKSSVNLPGMSASIFRLFLRKNIIQRKEIHRACLLNISLYFLLLENGTFRANFYLIFGIFFLVTRIIFLRSNLMYWTSELLLCEIILVIDSIYTTPR